ncbi:MAG: hypothetical protein B7Y39_09905 [Bdellovibrio sp. 28-41-41]|nr:MAG: hypothetical protein B7Y39_09905 [Bdellovibrio sp. 28-41-41]
MKRRREYIESYKIDLSSTNVNLIPVEDTSSDSSLRSNEIIELAAKMIRLASKKGPVAKVDREEFDAAA